MQTGAGWAPESTSSDPLARITTFPTLELKFRLVLRGGALFNRYYTTFSRFFKHFEARGGLKRQNIIEIR